MLENVRDVERLVELLRGFNPNELTQEVVRLGERWAELDGGAAALEETKKTLFASLALEYLEGGGTSGRPGEKPKPMPAGQAELRAYADGRYEDHLTAMVRARKEAHISRVRYDMGRMKLELMRSAQATLRQEMKFSQ